VSEKRAANGRFLLVRYRSKQPIVMDDATVPAFGLQDYGPGPTTVYLQRQG
jgi:hypothetical protein